jgi:hypothetical protein
MLLKTGTRASRPPHGAFAVIACAGPACPGGGAIFFIGVVSSRILADMGPWKRAQRGPGRWAAFSYCFGLEISQPIGGAVVITLRGTPKNKEALVCTILDEDGLLTTNIASENLPYYEREGCGLCRNEDGRANCNLANVMAPVLYYFSDIISYDEVTVDFSRKKYRSQYIETAQKACFAVCVYAMFYSSCEFFQQFKFLLRYYRANIDPDAYMHMILSTALIKRQVDLKTVHDHVDIFHEVARLASALEKRLARIFAEAKGFQKKDAAVNAIAIAFSLNTLSSEALKEFYEDFLERIRHIR